MHLYNSSRSGKANIFKIKYMPPLDTMLNNSLCIDCFIELNFKQFRFAIMVHAVYQIIYVCTCCSFIYLCLVMCAVLCMSFCAAMDFCSYKLYKQKSYFAAPGWYCQTTDTLDCRNMKFVRLLTFFTMTMSYYWHVGLLPHWTQPSIILLWLTGHKAPTN